MFYLFTLFRLWCFKINFLPLFPLKNSQTWQASPLINGIKVGFRSTAFAIWFLPQSRQEATPKNSARPRVQNWWKLPANLKMTLFWLLQERKHPPSNKFGLASSLNQVPRISIGLMARFRSTRTGLQVNPVEKPVSHAVTCGRAKHLLVVSEHQGLGMTCVVQ